MFNSMESYTFIFSLKHMTAKLSLKKATTRYLYIKSQYPLQSWLKRIYKLAFSRNSTYRFGSFKDSSTIYKLFWNRAEYIKCFKAFKTLTTPLRSRILMFDNQQDSEQIYKYMYCSNVCSLASSIGYSNTVAVNVFSLKE